MAVKGWFWHTSGMAHYGGLGFRWGIIARNTKFLMHIAGLVAALSGGVLAAQDAPIPQDASIPTLHVYTNLIQIPTLVLGPNRERLKTQLAEDRFSVSIDSGPWFRATHVRPEGDDPISLSILLDVSGGGATLMPKIDDAIAGLSPLSLHPKDRVSIYVLDCSLVRSLNDVPAESAQLKLGIDKALESWSIRQQNKRVSSCQQSIHLWDALAYITSELYKLPGRRVILAVSDGSDKGSVYSWNELRIFAQATGVAVFGMMPIPEYARAGTPMILRFDSESHFQSVCELSGGMLLFTNSRVLEGALQRFTAMLRERYIVEFPRPAHSTSGEHSMEVKIAKSNAFIRSAGISVPIPDAAVLADPTTVPSNPSLTPEPGTRKIMTKPQ